MKVMITEARIDLDSSNELSNKLEIEMKGFTDASEYTDILKGMRTRLGYYHFGTGRDGKEEIKIIKQGAFHMLRTLKYKSLFIDKSQTPGYQFNFCGYSAGNSKPDYYVSQLVF